MSNAATIASKFNGTADGDNAWTFPTFAEALDASDAIDAELPIGMTVAVNGLRVWVHAEGDATVLDFDGGFYS